MPPNALLAAVDLGASGGRVVLGEVGPNTLALHEVARFPNGAVKRPDGLHWDAKALRKRVLDGLARAAREAAGRGGVASIGVDSWAVDYALIRSGEQLADPFHYRDERRCALGPERVHSAIARQALYARNGLQFLPFNTLYQLAADGRLAEAERILLVPDLVTWWLTGLQVAERTNASTTGLLAIRTGEWDFELMTRLSFDRCLFPGLVDAGSRIGRVAGLAAETTGLAGVDVIAVGSHDTASALVGTPLEDERAAYISCGTWGLVGLELDAPVLSVAALEANFTNEGGVDGTVRFLTNVMGTWILSETLRAWADEGRPEDLVAILRAAAEVHDFVLIDVQDPCFVAPGDMETRIHAWCGEHHVTAPSTRSSMVRSIVESLAAAYAKAVDTAERLAGRTVDVLHIVGGGARNSLLCQAVANHSGRRVVAGPVEATAIGNLLVQARAAGILGPGLVELRAVVRATQATRTFHAHRPPLPSAMEWGE